MSVTMDMDSFFASGNIVDKFRTKIHRLWVEELQELEEEQGPDRLRHLKSQRRKGEDLLSLFVEAMQQRRSLEELTSDMAQQVRSHEYAGSGLASETFALLRALDRVTPKTDIDQWQAARMSLQKAAIQVCLAVLRETSDVYEYSVETSARGFCQVDGQDRILSANAAMLGILGCEEVQGRSLSDFFQDRDKAFLEMTPHTKKGKKGIKSRMKPMQLQRSGSEPLPVGVEVVPFDQASGRCQGVAALVDISGPMRLQKQVFDTSPLGILRVDLQRRITYANPRSGEFLSCSDLTGRYLRELFDDTNWAKIEKQLRKRFHRGLSDEYEAEALTFDAPRKPLPISIAATPERGMQGEIVGSLAIIRNLVVEKARERIHHQIETFQESHDLLNKVARELSALVPYVQMVVSVYSSDLRHVRSLFASSVSAGKTPQTRWWRMPAHVKRWVTNRKNLFIADLDSFLNQTKWQELRQDPDVQRLLEQNLDSIIRVPVFRETKLVASVSFFRHGKNAFSASDLDLLNRLPLSKAVLMALSREEVNTNRFRLNLMKDIIAVCENLDQVAEVLVQKLVEHYSWEKASIFEIDDKKGCFRLLRQYPPYSDFLYPKGYSQPLDQEGILKWVYRHRRMANICDVREDSRTSKDSQLESQGLLSVLCLPIGINEKLCWLLNMEDSRSNAFCQDEIDDLEVVLSEVSEALKAAHMRHLLEATLSSASDAVLVVDTRGRVVRDNPAVKRILGYERQDLRSKSMRRLFARPRLFDQVLAGARIAQDGVLLRSKDGAKLPVFLTAYPLPVELGGAVLIAKDLSLLKRLEEMKLLNRIYQEIALQTRPPLSLISSWLRRLQKRNPDPDAVETADKVLRQLRKVELTYDRLVLAGVEQTVKPQKLLLDPVEVVERVRENLPNFEREKIHWTIQSDLSPLWGDVYQLGYCLESILAYLMYFIPEDDAIQLELKQENELIALWIEGYVPTLDEIGSNSLNDAALLSRAEMDIALAERSIRNFIEKHDGRYHNPVRKGRRVMFHVDLPVKDRVRA